MHSSDYSPPPEITLPSGIPTLDKMLCGGLPPGTLTEIYGSPGAGKSTIALLFAAQAQNLDCNVALIDSECSFDPLYARALGVDLDRLLLIDTSDHSEALRIAYRLIYDNCVRVLIIDSVAALTAANSHHRRQRTRPLNDRDGEMLRTFLNEMRRLAFVTRTHIILINQTRQTLDPFNHPMEISAAGGIHLFCDNRIRLRHPEPVTAPDGTLPAAAEVKCILLRLNRTFTHREAILRLDYTRHIR